MGKQYNLGDFNTSNVLMFYSSFQSDGWQKLILSQISKTLKCTVKFANNWTQGFLVAG